MRPRQAAARLAAAVLSALVLAGGAAAPLTSAPPASPANGQLIQMLSAPGAPSGKGPLAALLHECPAAVPAAAAALAGQGPVATAAVDEGRYQMLASVASPVLDGCPPLSGRAGAAVARTLLAYLRGSAADPYQTCLPQAIARDVPAAELRAGLPTFSAAGAALAAEALHLALGPLFAKLVALQDRPAGLGLVQAALGRSAGVARSWLSSPRLHDRAVLLQLVQWAWARPGQGYAAWARAAAARQADPAVAEALLVTAYAARPAAADLTAYNRLADRYGTFRMPPNSGLHAGWQFVRAAAQADPRGYLARGIAAYERVEAGRPYFQVDACGGKGSLVGPCPFYTYGNRQFDPAREIPGWLAFLAHYPGHPAAADAAYRLARCYEIEGNWTQALHWMWLSATTYPDGAIADAAYGRLLFMLDVEMPRSALRAAAHAPLAAPVAQMVRYTLAVRLLRAGRYAQAAAALKAAAPPRGTSDWQGAVPWAQWPTALMVAQQQADAARMAALARQAFGAASVPSAAAGAWQGVPPVPPIRNAQAAYALAAVLYHHTLALYNNLWAGQQQFFFWYPGMINQLVNGNLTPAWVHSLRAMNTYVQALPIFQALARDPGAPASLRARALYSAGECLVQMDNFNVAFAATAQDSVTRADIVRTFRQFAATYPHDGALTADALLTVARYTHATSVIHAVESNFPKSWQAKAAAALQGVPLYAGYGQMGDYLLPPSPLGFGPAPGVHVRTGSGTGSRPGTAPGWTTVWVAPRGVPAGWGVELQAVAEGAPGRVTVQWALVSPAWQPLLPWARYGPVAVAQVPAHLSHVAFQEGQLRG